jgi:hypothetical protein
MADIFIYMNEENKFTPALSPWINEHLAPTWAKEVAKTIPKPSPVTASAGDIYRKCQDEILARLAKNPAQKWKLNGIKEDLAAHRESTLTDWFAKEVIALAEKQI